MTTRWSDVQRVYSADLQDHWTRSQALGLDYPLDVFEQLFFRPSRLSVSINRCTNRRGERCEPTHAYAHDF